MNAQPDTEWNKIQQAQADSEREYARLDSEARRRFNREMKKATEKEISLYPHDEQDPQLTLFD